ncbi:MAG: PQQ-dependent catabolism-associated CXXCW motif protein [Rhodobacteraceae bacterium]|nr:MAG: PQQ-dependent catabolism-associated CXXCW motif protein [Paracoccaceae bacterium]
MAVAGLALALTLPAALNADVPEPEDYRGAPYRAPVPATLAGADVLDDMRAHALWSAGEAVFIDVLPQAARPPDLPADMLWNETPRDSIPGAIWLPNTGYQGLSDAEMVYFTNALATASAGRDNAPMVFFCLEDCWMSWNAARRALEIGYSRVLWYPQGTDGWAARGWPLARVARWEATLPP